MTRYSELLDKGLIEPGCFSREQVEDLLKVAQQNLATSGEVLHIVSVGSDPLTFPYFQIVPWRFFT